MTINESYRGYEISIVSTSDSFMCARVAISSREGIPCYIETDPPVKNPMELVKKARAWVDAKLAKYAEDQSDE